MTRSRRLAGLVAALAMALAGCGATTGLVSEPPTIYLAARGLIASPSPERYSFCVDHGCGQVLRARLAPADWETVTAPLRARPADAAAERIALAEAVGRFEGATRRTLRLRPDLPGTYPGAFAPDQNDCVDETSNTTTLLLMLDGAGLLRFHAVGPPARRGAFVDVALPHRSATIRERAGGQRYALDSWFRPSGIPADLAPLEAWLKGWTPPGGAWS